MAWTAGCSTFEVFDGEAGNSFPLLVLYPSDDAGAPAQFGPYSIRVAMNGAVAAGVFPLVVISHGSGGSHLVYRDLAMHLARNGFVIAMPEHPKNNRNNNELAGTAAILANRPRHIRLVMDWLEGKSPLRASLKPNSVAIVGHSLGGYTALALAGGVPTAFARETSNHRPQRVEVIPDERLQALVLLAPAAAWFAEPDALTDVRTPIFMLTAENDVHTPEWHAEVITRGLPRATPLEYRVVPNAGHFSFLSPFPEAMTHAGFPPSQDPAGFDRPRFQQEMSGEVLAFLQRVMPA